MGGLVCLATGYALDLSSVTPIIKRISTSSFVLVSAGWVALILAGLYWITDVRGWTKHSWILKVVGMNAIFIYLFFEIVGSRWFNDYVAAVTDGLMTMAHFPTILMNFITCFTIFGLEWGLCYFLYKKKIFFRL